MGNATRKWLPLALIAVTVAATAYVTRNLPDTVGLDLRGVLPFTLEPSGDTAPRWVAVIAIPTLATVVWAALLFSRTRPALGFTRRLFRGLPEALGNPATIERFRPTHDTIALAVVVLILGLHAGMIASALGYDTLPARIISVVMGASLIFAGNVMPRLRPNLIAGVRTRRALTDPMLWRATHRVLGVTFVFAGAITILVGLVAPSFGLLTGVVTLVLACIVASIVGARGRDVAAV